MNRLSRDELEMLRLALVEQMRDHSHSGDECPTDEAFVALAEGSLPNEVCRELLVHVAECTKCATAAREAARVVEDGIASAPRWSRRRLLYIGAAVAAVAASVLLLLSTSGRPGKIPMVLDPDDPREIAGLLHAIGIENPTFHRLETQRGGGLVVQLIQPRGLVRRSDLDVLRVDLGGGTLPSGARLEIRRGSEVLHGSPFTPEATSLKAPIPESVRNRLKPGDEVVWGLWAADGAQVASAGFQVVDDESEERLAELGRSLKAQAPPVPQMARIALLLQEELLTGALREAESCVKSHPESVWCWAALVEALRRNDLAATAYAQQAQAWLEQLPDASRVVRRR